MYRYFESRKRLFQDSDPKRALQVAKNRQKTSQYLVRKRVRLTDCQKSSNKIVFMYTFLSCNCLNEEIEIQPSEEKFWGNVSPDFMSDASDIESEGNPTK